MFAILPRNVGAGTDEYVTVYEKIPEHFDLKQFIRNDTRYGISCDVCMQGFYQKGRWV
jgi:hypothetical protein